MCFRPAEAGGDGGGYNCPDCGKKIQNLGGIPMKKCPFCKCDFTPYLNGEKEFPNKSSAPAPGAPAAPGAPSAPKAPGAPKPPTA